MTRYSVTLTTPEAVFEQLNTTKPGEELPSNILTVGTTAYTAFYNYVIELIYMVSDYVMQTTGRSFVPYTDERTIVYEDAQIVGNELTLDEDLLIPSTFEVGGVLISGSSYRLLPSNSLPSTFLVYNRAAAAGASTEWGQGFLISGVWGYHTNLSQAWSVIQTDFTCTGSETLITVTDASQFESLQYLRCETEMMRVTGKNTASNQLRVERGVNGTESEAHSAVPLEVFHVVPAMALCVTRLVAYLYQRRTDVGQVVRLPDGTVMIANLPEAVQMTLDLYARRPVPRSPRTYPAYMRR